MTTDADQLKNLTDEMRRLIVDAEAAMGAAFNSPEAATLKERLQSTLASAKERVLDAQEIVTERARKAVHATDDFAHDHPWRAVGVAAAVGALVAMAVSCGRGRD